METIVATILTGLFSLSGIWYQNYLNNKSTSNLSSVTTVQSEPSLRKEAPNKAAGKSKNGLRIFFTMLIVLLPWVLFQVILPYLSYERFGDEDGRERAMFIYYMIWFFITIIAMVSGWKAKTNLEKIALAASAVFLFFNFFILQYKSHIFG